MSNNHISDLLKVVFVPIHKEGIKFILIFAVVAIILAMLNNALGTIGLVLTLWCVFFFRDPTRFTPQGENLIISPADGVVNLIEEDALPPVELSLEKGEWTKISVFLNVFNVHVNRAPIAGKITQVKYQPGKFFSANLEEASTHNERNSAVVETKNGEKIVFVQVAGLVARRIVSTLEEGQEIEAGDRYGIIRFGSRADIYLPKTTDIKILVGQTMVGGETVIAELKK
ncbi:MAG: phosphatidylserine decarboxylase [Rickettsiales bacterium]|jgi:phosphatidylserine decarboxylase